jgi:hypothetical protein
MDLNGKAIIGQWKWAVSACSEKSPGICLGHRRKPHASSESWASESVFGRRAPRSACHSPAPFGACESDNSVSPHSIILLASEAQP